MFAEILLLAALLVVYLGVSFRKKTSYWRERGISEPTDSPFPMGNNPMMCTDTLFGRENTNIIMQRQYGEIPVSEKVYGTYGPNGVPILMIRDPDMIHRILSTS